jgi:hypothetical protein
MRLIITGLWGQLESATSEEIETLAQSAAKGNWRGPTEALAARRGHPVGVTEERATPTGPPLRLIVVQRGEVALAERLRAITRPRVPVIWDRRARERRTSDGAVSVDRRQRPLRDRGPRLSPLCRPAPDRGYGDRARGRAAAARRARGWRLSRRRDGPSLPPDPLSIAASAPGHIRARRGPVLTHVSPEFAPGALWPLPGRSAAR